MSLPQDAIDRVDQVIARALELDIELRQVGERRWRGGCSGCGDATSMELKVDLDDRRLWLNCWHATCTEQARLLGLGLTIEDLRPPPAKEPGRLVRHKLSTVELETVEFLVPDRVPRRAVTLLGGDPGLGKSLWTCLIAAEASAGMHGPASAVAILNAEDTRSVVRSRVQAAGGNLDLVELLVKEDGLYEEVLTLPDDVSHIEEFVIDTGASLVVIDPLMAFLTDKADANQDHSVRRALANLALMADRRDVAVVAVSHLNKSEQLSIMYRVGGSIGLVGAARSLLLFATDPDDDSKRLLAHAKANWAKLAATERYRLDHVNLEHGDRQLTTVVLRSDGLSDLSAEQLIGRRRAEGKLSEAAEAIERAVSEGARPSNEVKTEVAEEVGCAIATVKRAAESLVQRHVLRYEQAGRQTYWRRCDDSAHLLPKDDPDPGSEGSDTPTVKTALSDPDQAHPGEGNEPDPDVLLETVSNGLPKPSWELSYEERAARLRHMLGKD